MAIQQAARTHAETSQAPSKRNAWNSTNPRAGQTELRRHRRSVRFDPPQPILRLSAQSAVEFVQEVEQALESQQTPLIYIDDLQGLSQEYVGNLISRFDDVYVCGKAALAALEPKASNGRRASVQYVLSMGMGALMGLAFCTWIL